MLPYQVFLRLSPSLGRMKRIVERRLSGHKKSVSTKQVFFPQALFLQNIEGIFFLCFLFNLPLPIVSFLVTSVIFSEILHTRNEQIRFNRIIYLYNILTSYFKCCLE